MRSQVKAIGNHTTCPYLCSSWMKDSKHHQRIKPEQGYDTLCTTTIAKVNSTLDKLKEACAINAEAERRQPCLGVPLAALLTMFSIIP